MKKGSQIKGRFFLNFHDKKFFLENVSCKGSGLFVGEWIYWE